MHTLNTFSEKWVKKGKKQGKKKQRRRCQITGPGKCLNESNLPPSANSLQLRGA